MTTARFATKLARLVQDNELQLVEVNRLADGTHEVVYETQDDLERISLIRIYQLPVDVDVEARNRQQSSH